MHCAVKGSGAARRAVGCCAPRATCARVIAVLVALACCDACDVAHAQTPPAVAPPSETTRLPETVVEAMPPEPTRAPADPFGFRAASPFDGTYYDSPLTSRPVAGYSAPSVTIGMLADTPISSVPQSIGIVTESLIKDRQIFSVTDAFRNVSGVFTDHTTGSTAANASEFNYLIRGFSTTYRRWNGYRSDLIQTSIDTTNIERIEFIKGPSSVLYGATDAGGFLNIVTKKPLDANFARASLSTGSWGLARADVDVNRTWGDDVGFRINVGLQQKDSFRDYVNDDRITVAPVVSLELTDRTRLTLEGEYYSTNTTFDVGVARVGGSFDNQPVGRSLMDPTDRAFGDYYKAGVTLDHAFSDDWSGRLGYSYATTSQRTQAHLPATLIGNQAVQVPVYQINQGRLPTLMGNLAGTFETGTFTHHVASSAEYQWIDLGTTTEFFFGAPVFLDATNPAYAGNFPSAVNPAVRTARIRGQIVSLQDRIEINDYVEIVGGISYQNFDRSFTVRDTFFGASADVSDHAWTPRGSLLLHPVPDFLSAWYSYTESVFPQTLVNSDVAGRPLPPTAGRQHEIGLRAGPIERWWASVALFDLTKSSVPLFTPFGSVVPVDARSLGIEFDLYGSLTERLSMTANYAYLDTRVTSDPVGIGALGRQVPLVPHNSANVWSRYNLIDEPLGVRGAGNSGAQPRRVVGVGAGLRWVSSSRTQSYPNYFEFGGEQILPKYVTADLGLFSRSGRKTANLYFENLTNARYYTSGLGSFANPGNPITVRATVGVTF